MNARFAVVKTSNRVSVGKVETLPEAQALAKTASADMGVGMTVVTLNARVRTPRTKVVRMCVLRMKSGKLVNKGMQFTREQAIAMSNKISDLGHTRPTVEFCK